MVAPCGSLPACGSHVGAGIRRWLAVVASGSPLVDAMSGTPGISGAPSGIGALIGRVSERAALDRLLESVRCGESQALVLRGEAGVGKTALLDYLAAQASGCRVLHAAGAQSEIELAYAGLHQLCAPMVERLPALPVPQREALGTVFGISSGPAPDRFLIGLGVLSLLSEATENQPLLCLVDDEQWLDHASAQVLAFVARRLGAESVGLVFAARVVSPDLTALPEIAVPGLPDADARTLLDSVLTGPMDARVRDQIVAETRGNPLALLELPRGLTPSELAGGFGFPDAMPLAGTIEESFRRRLAALPQASRRLLLLAATDPSGDPALVWRAATLLGIVSGAAGAATAAGLAEFDTRVRFRHPLVRAAAYRSASMHERQEAHRALAQATDVRLDPDRRAWHRAQAISGPDADVAADLERSAERARARGGMAAAAAFLERAATLTLDPQQRGRRALIAAQAKIQAGAFDAAGELLAMAQAEPLRGADAARLGLSQAQLAFCTRRGNDVPALLLSAAQQLENIDAGLARATYLDALSAAIFAGRLAGPGGAVADVARAARTAPAAVAPRAADLLLAGLTAEYTDGYAAGLSLLRAAANRFGRDMPAEEELHWLWLASVTAMRVWDDDLWDALSARHVHLARETGALSELPLALTSRAYALLFAGDLAAVASLRAEVQAVKEATGSHLAPYCALGLGALRGDEAPTLALAAATREDVTRRGEGVGITFAEWAEAVLNNGLGKYPDAMAAALRATAYDADLGSLIWPAVELIEAAARSDMPDTAAHAYRRLAEMTTAAGTDWALGVQGRSSALLCEGERAERLYRTAIVRLGRTRMRVDLARTHLVFGEWLRRERRAAEAREHLRTAHGMLESMGVAAFAERAGRELRAAGGTVHKRVAGSRHEELTAQEFLIARLARDGLSNPEIGTRLFISARTVQYHLRKVFTKLGIASRSNLDSVL